VDVIKPYGHYYMVANNPAIAPLGEAKPNTEIFRLLSKAMGFTDACFGDSDDEIAQAAVADHWDFAAVRQKGWKRIGPAKGTARFANGGFDTPSGKVEFLSASARNAGLDALPDYIAPLEDTRSELAKRYPLAMISPPARNFLNSSFVNVESLRASEGEPWLDVHPLDAVVARDRGRRLCSGVQRARQPGIAGPSHRSRPPGRRSGPVGVVEKIGPRRQERQRIDEQRHAHRRRKSADFLRLPCGSRGAVNGRSA